MPYIERYDRELVVEKIKSVTGRMFVVHPDNITSVGDLNYAITVLCKDYLEKQGKSYKTINDVIGVLQCAKAEFYRRVAAPYEDKKIKENGDVY